MDTYIVRVYRYPDEKNMSYLGIVEFTDGTPHHRFTSDAELVKIIADAKLRSKLPVRQIRRR